MKRFTALLLVALFLLAAALAEAPTDGYGFEFGDDGYTGEWIALRDLNLAFCLPEGWTGEEAQEGESFCAATDSGACLTIRPEGRDVADLTAWAEQNLEQYEVERAGKNDVVIEATEDGALVVRFTESGGRLIAFCFEALGEDRRAFALQVVGSAYEVWDGEFPFDTGEGAD